MYGIPSEGVPSTIVIMDLGHLDKTQMKRKQNVSVSIHQRPFSY